MARLTMLNGHKTASHILFSTELMEFHPRFMDRQIARTWPEVSRCSTGRIKAGGGRMCAGDGKLVIEPSFLVPFKAEATSAGVVEYRTLADMVRGQEYVLILSELYARPQLRRVALRFIDSKSLTSVLQSLQNDRRDVDLGFMQELTGADATDEFTAEQVANEFGGFTVLDDRVFVTSKGVL